MNVINRRAIPIDILKGATNKQIKVSILNDRLRRNRDENQNLHAEVSSISLREKSYAYTTLFEYLAS